MNNVTQKMRFENPQLALVDDFLANPEEKREVFESARKKQVALIKKALERGFATIDDVDLWKEDLLKYG
jgi:hypothetical protein